jgi:hypothetical protein
MTPPRLRFELIRGSGLRGDCPGVDPRPDGSGGLCRAAHVPPRHHRARRARDANRDGRDQRVRDHRCVERRRCTHGAGEIETSTSRLRRGHGRSPAARSGVRTTGRAQFRNRRPVVLTANAPAHRFYERGVHSRRGCRMVDFDSAGRGVDTDDRRSSAQSSAYPYHRHDGSPRPRLSERVRAFRVGPVPTLATAGADGEYTRR